MDEVPGFHPEPLVAVVGDGLCCDGVDEGGRFTPCPGLRMEAPPRSKSYEGVSMVVRAEAVVLRLPRRQQFPCSPEGVGNSVWVALPRALVSSDVGVFGVFSA